MSHLELCTCLCAQSCNACNVMMIYDNLWVCYFVDSSYALLTYRSLFTGNDVQNIGDVDRLLALGVV